jgi:hypothetical protein
MTIRLRFLMTCVGLFAICAMGQTSAVHSADEPASRGTTSAKVEKAVRLPNHFGKLALSEKQKADVYDAIRRYRSEIDTLETRLDELRREQQATVENLLTADQRQQLETLRSASKSKSTASRTTTSTSPTK